VNATMFFLAEGSGGGLLPKHVHYDTLYSL